MSHRQLTEGLRYQISAYREEAFSLREIADKIDIHHSTISRELRRNKIKKDYDPEHAHAMATVKRTFARKARKITLEVENVIIFLLNETYSPAKICAILESSMGIKLTTSTLYNHIENDRINGGEIYKLLPLRGRAKRSDKNYKPAKYKVKPEQLIDNRPKAANERTRLGDLEIDTIISKDRKGGVLTAVDRKTRYLWAKIIPNLNAETVKQALIEMLAPFKNSIKTITCDNGGEFAKHGELAKALGCKFYFCHPYASWQRGTVERLNREIRLFYPKRTNFHELDENLFQSNVDIINFKPRECLKMKSPHNTFLKTGEFWQQKSVVQLLLECRVFV